MLLIWLYPKYTTTVHWQNGATPIAKASMLFDSSFSSVGNTSASHLAAKYAWFASYACIKTEANATWEVLSIMTLHWDHLSCITDSVRHMDDREKNGIFQDRNLLLASIRRNETACFFSWCSFEALVSRSLLKKSSLLQPPTTSGLFDSDNCKVKKSII